MIRRLFLDPRGATAAEYALILAILGAAISLAAFTLGENISNAMDAMSVQIAG